MRIVDGHVHVLPDALRVPGSAAVSDPWFALCHAAARSAPAGPDDLLTAMERDGVDLAVCLSWPFASPPLLAEQNDWLAGLARAHPGRIVAFGCVNPADPGAADEVRRCARLGLRGIGELNADAQGWRLDGVGELQPVVRACIETAMPWNLHTSDPVGHAYPGKGTAVPALVAPFASAYPDLRIVLAHLGGGLPLYAHMPEIRELCRANLWFDTAAVPYLYDAGVYGTIAGLVGADRLLLGSDFPLLGIPRHLDGLSAVLAPEDVAMVAGGAGRLLAV